ncbi:MAG: Holliday junction branch migration protein RuvA [Rhodospirillales bacterium]|nr:Holliday junction branch migration protein RuvA [Rhodospirillales bacterium]
MIAKLTGRIDTLGEDFAIIDVSGVGYLVFCSGRTLGRLTEGEHASILIETHVREDHIHLYGFMEAAERDWFKLLTTVQGVGAKVGLAILTALGAEELLHAIAAGDRTTLTRASGVGAKLAGRIASELKDKVGGLALGPVGLPGVAVSGAATGSATADAVSALVNLGYSASDAFRAVAHAAGSMGDDADLEALIRGGLAELAPREHAS